MFSLPQTRVTRELGESAERGVDWKEARTQEQFAVDRDRHRVVLSRVRVNGARESVERRLALPVREIQVRARCVRAPSVLRRSRFSRVCMASGHGH
jgi:hypothetical protein